MADLFPPSLLKPAAKQEVLQWLRTLPIPPARRKDLLIHWADQVAILLSADDFIAANAEELTTPPAQQ